MSEQPTPETDAAELVYDGKLSSGYADVDVCRRMERERDEARAKIERQAERIRYLEGATNHACGTPLTLALSERDEARAALQRLADCDWVITPRDRMDAVREIARVALAKTLPASAGDAGVSRASRGDLHEAGVVGALRERLNRVMGLLRDVERETRQPSEHFDEVWAEVREVLRG